MTPSEFKAWFEVFCEAVDGTPTPKQWAKIKAKVEALQMPSNHYISGGIGGLFSGGAGARSSNSQLGGAANNIFSYTGGN